MGVETAALASLAVGSLASSFLSISQANKATKSPAAAPPVDTKPKEDLEKEKEGLEDINDPTSGQNKRKRVQAIKNVGGIVGEEVSAVGTGNSSGTLFGN